MGSSKPQHGVIRPMSGGPSGRYVRPTIARFPREGSEIMNIGRMGNERERPGAS